MNMSATSAVVENDAVDDTLSMLSLLAQPLAVLAFAKALLVKAGMPDDKADAVASILVEGELLGRSTHGLALLAPYLKELAAGAMTLDGDPTVISDFGACLTWDGRKLPGPWLVCKALDEAMDRAARFGIGAVAIQRSHHAASLGAYLKAATERGFLGFITLTDPAFSSVAPFGGTKPVLTSNPFAFGAPTRATPIIVDVSTSMVTNGMVAKMKREARKFEEPWLLDAQGEPSTDPNVIFADPPGTVLPLGGLEAGHKGYGLGMMIEILSGCLSGYGRAEPSAGWSAAVFVMAIDPAVFGGHDAYMKQVTWLVDACHQSPPRPGFERVLLPGEASTKRRERQQNEGMRIDAATLQALQPWMKKLGVAPPKILS
jgi:LDH2 family malate/lactate/ureidoglycolate dehydrogenase